MNPLLWLMVFVKRTNKTMTQKLVICEILFPYFENYQFLFSCFIVLQITIFCLLFHCFISQNHKPLAKHQSNKEGGRLDPNLHGNSVNQSRIKVKCMWNKIKLLREDGQKKCKLHWSLNNAFAVTIHKHLKGVGAIWSHTIWIYSCHL